MMNNRTLSDWIVPVKQKTKRFNPDEIRTTKISLGRLGRLGRRGKHSTGHSEAGEINIQRFPSLIRLEVFVYYRPLIISVRISKAFIFRKLFTFSSEPSWR